MAFSSLFTLIDDIASILDDVALMTKMAAKKTVGVVGDDLALNANQVTGASSDRELPIVWAVTKGSLVNKVILIPIALFMSIGYEYFSEFIENKIQIKSRYIELSMIGIYILLFVICYSSYIAVCFGSTII